MMNDSNEMCPNERLAEELEFLLSIYFEEIQHLSPSDGFENVCMNVHPATAGNEDEQFVRITLDVAVPPEYPELPPVISYKNPRGLSDEAHCRLQRNIADLIEASLGEIMLLQIFEMARDSLTESNIPHGDCAICYCGFESEGGDFIKTECYHHFHMKCFTRYKEYWLANSTESDHDRLPHEEPPEKLFVCPVCRKPISIPEWSATRSPSVDQEVFKFVVSDELKLQQIKWKKMFERQQANGGIIDLEAERAKYYIPPSTKPEDLESTGADENVAQSAGSPVAQGETSSAVSDDKDKGNHHKGHDRSIRSQKSLRSGRGRRGGYHSHHKDYHRECQHHGHSRGGRRADHIDASGNVSDVSSLSQDEKARRLGSGAHDKGWSDYKTCVHGLHRDSQEKGCRGRGGSHFTKDGQSKKSESNMEHDVAKIRFANESNDNRRGLPNRQGRGGNSSRGRRNKENAQSPLNPVQLDKMTGGSVMRTFELNEDDKNSVPKNVTDNVPAKTSQPGAAGSNMQHTQHRSQTKGNRRQYKSNGYRPGTHPSKSPQNSQQDTAGSLSKDTDETSNS